MSTANGVRFIPGIITLGSLLAFVIFSVFGLSENSREGWTFLGRPVCFNPKNLGVFVVMIAGPMSTAGFQSSTHIGLVFSVLSVLYFLQSLLAYFLQSIRLSERKYLPGLGAPMMRSFSDSSVIVLPFAQRCRERSTRVARQCRKVFRISNCIAAGIGLLAISLSLSHSISVQICFIVDNSILSVTVLMYGSLFVWILQRAVFADDTGDLLIFSHLYRFVRIMHIVGSMLILVSLVLMGVVITMLMDGVNRLSKSTVFWVSVMQTVTILILSLLLSILEWKCFQNIFVDLSRNEKIDFARNSDILLHNKLLLSNQDLIQHTRRAPLYIFMAHLLSELNIANLLFMHELNYLRHEIADLNPRLKWAFGRIFDGIMDEREMMDRKRSRSVSKLDWPSATELSFEDSYGNRIIVDQECLSQRAESRDAAIVVSGAAQVSDVCLTPEKSEDRKDKTDCQVHSELWFGKEMGSIIVENMRLGMEHADGDGASADPRTRFQLKSDRSLTDVSRDESINPQSPECLSVHPFLQFVYGMLLCFIVEDSVLRLHLPSAIVRIASQEIGEKTLEQFARPYSPMALSADDLGCLVSGLFRISVNGHRSGIQREIPIVLRDLVAEFTNPMMGVEKLLALLHAASVQSVNQLEMALARHFLMDGPDSDHLLQLYRAYHP